MSEARMTAFYMISHATAKAEFFKEPYRSIRPAGIDGGNARLR